MKFSKLIFFCMFSFLLVFSSCKKDEVSEMEDVIDGPDTEVVTTNPLVPQMSATSTNDGLNLGCFTVDFPFDLIVDGETVAIEDIEDFEEALMDLPEMVDFAYPLDITYEDGTTESIVDAEALGAAFANCIPDTEWDENLFPAFLISDESSCYDMVYPVDLVDLDGNVVTANDEEEFIDLISQAEPLFFEFPVSLVDEDGDTVTANNDEELFVLLFECEDIDVPGGDPIGDCWDFSYPFEMVDQDGNVIVINDHDDYCNAMLQGLDLEFVFPLTLVNGDGEELVVNNNDELTEAWLDCFPTDVELDITGFLISSDLLMPESCYSIIYPFEYINNNTGDLGTLEDEAAAQAYIDNGSGNWADVVIFPVTVTDLDTGDEVTFNDFIEYLEYMSTCE